MGQNLIKILIVDDEEVTNETCERMLKRRLNCEVLSLTNGRSAIETIRGTHFDLVLLDLSMEGCNGYEVINEVRKFNKDIKIIVITGHTEDNLSEQHKHLIEEETSGRLHKGRDHAPQILNKIIEIFGKSILLDISTLKESEYKGGSEPEQVFHALRGIVGVVTMEIEDYFYAFKNGFLKEKNPDIHIEYLQNKLQNILRSMAAAQKELDNAKKH